MATMLRGGTHSPRAVLATAAEFQDVPRSMAEYIHNSFQYRRDRTKQAKVAIKFGRDADGGWYEVSDFDNGAGMDLRALERFFTMHAPNEERLRGEAGRGRHGTGKAAALGVGESLIVFTVKNGIMNEVRLHKRELLARESVYPCEDLPLEHTIENQPVGVGEPRDGTRVTVKGIKTNFDEEGVIRNFARLFHRLLDYNELYWERRSGTVRVAKPAHSPLHERYYSSPPELADFIGDVELRLAAAEVDLPRQECGVIVTSVGGNVLEDCYINIPKRRSVVDKRIFGEVHVPLLDQPDAESRLSSTQARRLQMNRESERVQKLLPWLDECIEDFRAEVESRLRSSLDERDQAVLEIISGTFEKVLNRQYTEFMKDYATRMNLQKVTGPSAIPGAGTAVPAGPAPNGTGETVFVPDSRGPDSVNEGPEGDLTIATPRGDGGEGGDKPGTSGNRKGRLDPEGVPATQRRRGSTKTQGGASIRVLYLGVGRESTRAYYDGEGTITINVDHPDLDGLEKTDFEFMRRSADACAMTYAQAVIEMRLRDGDPTLATQMDALNGYMDEHDKVLRPLIDACP